MYSSRSAPDLEQRREFQPAVADLLEDCQPPVGDRAVEKDIDVLVGSWSYSGQLWLVADLEKLDAGDAESVESGDVLWAVIPRFEVACPGEDAVIPGEAVFVVDLFTVDDHGRGRYQCHEVGRHQMAPDYDVAAVGMYVIDAQDGVIAEIAQREGHQFGKLEQAPGERVAVGFRQAHVESRHAVTLSHVGSRA